MYVCICRRVTDKTIRQCAREGACTVDEVGNMCRAGTDCGNCQDMIEDLIQEERPGHLHVLQQLAS